MFDSIKKQILSIITMVFSILIMAITKGVAMDFASQSEKIIEYYSYFSLMPVGYGNWFPMITAILSIIVLVFLFANVKINCQKFIKLFLIIIIVANILSWIVFSSFSVLALLVLVLHLVVLILEIFKKNIEK